MAEDAEEFWHEGDNILYTGSACHVKKIMSMWTRLRMFVQPSGEAQENETEIIRVFPVHPSVGHINYLCQFPTKPPRTEQLWVFFPLSR